jgi:hypothetical protein
VGTMALRQYDRWTEQAEGYSPVSHTDTTEADRPRYEVSTYTVFPSGFDRVSGLERDHWRIFVVDAGDGWAVRWRRMCLNIRGTWEIEPPARVRGPEFLHRCRFSERNALDRARKAVDRLTVNGLTYDEFVVEVHEEAAAKARELVAAGQSGFGDAGAAIPLHSRLMRALRPESYQPGRATTGEAV